MMNLYRFLSSMGALFYTGLVMVTVGSIIISFPNESHGMTSSTRIIGVFVIVSGLFYVALGMMYEKKEYVTRQRRGQPFPGSHSGPRSSLLEASAPEMQIATILNSLPDYNLVIESELPPPSYEEYDRYLKPGVGSATSTAENGIA